MYFALSHCGKTRARVSFCNGNKKLKPKHDEMIDGKIKVSHKTEGCVKTTEFSSDQNEGLIASPILYSIISHPS